MPCPCKNITTGRVQQLGDQTLQKLGQSGQVTVVVQLWAPYVRCLLRPSSHRVCPKQACVVLVIESVCDPKVSEVYVFKDLCWFLYECSRLIRRIRPLEIRRQVLSATDPVAVVALFSTLGVSPKLTMFLGGGRSRSWSFDISAPVWWSIYGVNWCTWCKWCIYRVNL